MRSVMMHRFSQVPKAEIQRSSFDRSHGFKTTFNSGYLVPIFIDEALPGDTFNLRATTFARLSTPLHPYMDNLFCDVFFFACPNRLVWSHWVNQQGEQDNPDDTTDYLVPQITSPAGGYAVGTIYDYLGLPTGIAGMSHNALPLRMCNLIFNQWFRDQNLQDSLPVPTGDGPDPSTDYVLFKRGKRHDYFTSCLPWPQKGPSVQLPIGSAATVKTDPSALLGGVHNPLLMRRTDTGNPADQVLLATQGSTGQMWETTTNPGSTYAASLYPANLYADLSTATAATINQLRQAFQIQRIYERDARGGTRYTEIIKAHFGVDSPDARLQRTEYLGGGSTRINVNPIAQTSATSSGDTPQGNLAAMATFTHSGIGFTKSFTEHSYVIGFLCVRADLNYQQGLNRMWSRSTRFDFYWPALSHIGEQSVLNKEIYCDGSANDNLTFGYQERYAEYRYKPSVITGEFRSSYVDTLDSWHLAQSFGSLPVLNDSFIQENPPVSRIVAVEDEPQFMLDAFFSYKCARPMPTYSVPGLIDHF